MNYKGHLGTATLFSVVTAGGIYVVHLENEHIPLETVALTIPLGILGAHFPDLDTDSIPSRWCARICLIASLALFGYGFYESQIAPLLLSSLVGIFFMTTKISKHRGWTHNYLVPIAIGGGSFVIPNLEISIQISLIAFAIGIFSHLLADSIFPWQGRAWRTI